MNNQNNSQEFVRVYNQIEKYLKNVVPKRKTQPFWITVNQAGERNRAVQEYRNDLLEYSRLRNAIVHAATNKTMAEPHDEAVEHIKKLYELITKPPTAADLFKKKVHLCSPKGVRLMEVVDVMRQFDYTQVPIYEENKFLGLLTENVILKLFSELGKKEKPNLDELMVEEALPFTEGQYYRVVSEDTNVYTILDYFLEFVEKEQRLECVLITKSGNLDEMPTGIATTWDVPLIKRLH